MKDLIGRLSELGLRLARTLFFLAPLGTRLVLGLAFIQTGLGKWNNLDNVVAFFTDLGIPFPQANAAFVASLELVGGYFLLAGVLTRLMATGLASTMVVALMTADKEAFLGSWAAASETSPTDVAAFTFLLLLSWLALAGPGPLSLDYLLARWLGVGRLPSKEPLVRGGSQASLSSNA
jgi:putative oxidoreductase